jgi:hypothetical protein
MTPRDDDEPLGPAKGLFYALRWLLPLYAGLGLLLGWWLW